MKNENSEFDGVKCYSNMDMGHIILDDAKKVGAMAGIEVVRTVKELESGLCTKYKFVFMGYNFVTLKSGDDHA